MLITRPQRKQQKVDELEDKISNLPDALLTQILSLLSTKEAVRTSILSNRWKSIWASVPTLDFSDKDWGHDDDVATKEATFRKFVDIALIARKMPSLEYIAICGPEIDPTVVKSWISAAVDMNIRSLHLSICYSEPILVLPQCLFSCHTLVVLKLNMISVLNFPVLSTTCFPSLKVLQLCLVRFNNKDSAENFISSCPVLEDLDITIDEWDATIDGRTIYFEGLNITSRTLKTLSLDYVFVPSMLVSQSKIIINTPALENIIISNIVTYVYEIVENLSSVVYAKFHVLENFNMIHGQCARSLFELLSTMSNISSLSISSRLLKAVSTSPWSLQWPIFHNLTTLEFNGYNNLDNEWDWMMEFLRSSPLLEVLIYNEFSYFMNKVVNWMEVIPSWVHDVPSCFSSHLKTIKIRGYLGKSEMPKVTYFLENATVLETMTVEIASGEQLLMIPTGSSKCKVIIQ